MWETTVHFRLLDLIAQFNRSVRTTIEWRAEPPRSKTVRCLLAGQSIKTSSAVMFELRPDVPGAWRGQVVVCLDRSITVLVTFGTISS